MAEIYLAGGCFWGLEEYFSRISGVLATMVTSWSMAIIRNSWLERASITKCSKLQLSALNKPFYFEILWTKKVAFG